jgi:hypothetical protein
MSATKITKSSPKNDLVPVARVIARTLVDAKTQEAYDALPEASRKEASQMAWKIVGEIQRYEDRRERATRRLQADE